MRNGVMQTKEFKSWNRQVELFAEYFLCHANLPSRENISFLDAGCGTGASAKVIHGRYPLLKLSGCDKEEEHIEISQHLYGQYGKFFVSDIAKINELYDIVYISNVLEHLVSWEEVVRKLLIVCRRMYLMMPFQESIHFDESHPGTGSDHVVSFQRKSFDVFRTNSVNVSSRVIRTPFAWGHPLLREIVIGAKSRLRNQKFIKKRQLIVALSHKDLIRDILPESPFFTPPVSYCKFLKIKGAEVQ